jgi:hypothetical protein
VAGGVRRDAGYVLASAMAGLPQQKVSHVLASAWASWLNWHTTDAQPFSEVLKTRCLVAE